MTEGERDIRNWLILPTLLVIALAACVGNAPAPVSNACSTGVADIIHPSRLDTPETLKQIDIHNKQARILCPDGR